VDLQLKLDRGTDEAVADVRATRLHADRPIRARPAFLAPHPSPFLPLQATRDAVAAAVKELTGESGPLRTTRSLNAAVSKVASEQKRAVSGGSRSAAGSKSSILSRLGAGGGGGSKLRPDTVAQQARTQSRMAAARAKAEENAQPWLEQLADDDERVLGGEAGSPETSALSKVIQRERRVGRQTLARHLLHRAFDVMDKTGLKGAYVGRKLAVASGDATDRATAATAYDGSTAVGFSSLVPAADGSASSAAIGLAHSVSASAFADASATAAPAGAYVLGRVVTASNVRVAARPSTGLGTGAAAPSAMM